MRYLYYKQLSKRVEALERAWAWATPRTFGWVDSKGDIEILSENNAARRPRERAERLDPLACLESAKSANVRICPPDPDIARTKAAISGRHAA